MVPVLGALGYGQVVFIVFAPGIALALAVAVAAINRRWRTGRAGSKDAAASG